MLNKKIKASFVEVFLFTKKFNMIYLFLKSFKVNKNTKKSKVVLSGDTIEIKHLNGVSSYLTKTPPVGNNLKDTKYSKGEFSSSINNFLEKKKNEIPLYDPQTGEPNPFYEKLTGKKNPLLNTPKMLNPQIKECKLKNRFLVYLPKEFGVDVWNIKFVNKPKIIINPKKFLGFTYSYEKIYSQLSIEIHDTIGNKNKNLLKFLENQQEFSFYIEELDPTGVVIDKFDFYDCTINYLSFGDLDYNSDEINNIMLSITIGKLEIK